VKLEKGHFRDVHFAHERTRTPSLLFLVLSPHLVLSMLFFETDTLRHFVALLPQGRIQDQDHQEPNTAYTAKGEEA